MIIMATIYLPLFTCTKLALWFIPWSSSQNGFNMLEWPFRPWFLRLFCWTGWIIIWIFFLILGHCTDPSSRWCTVAQWMCGSLLESSRLAMSSWLRAGKRYGQFYCQQNWQCGTSQFQQILQADIYRPEAENPDAHSCPYSDLTCGISYLFEVVFGQTWLLI